MKDIYKVIFVVVGAIFIAFYLYQRRPLTREECYRLGSNERMLLCLQEVAQSNPTPEPVLLPDSELGLIILNGGRMTGNTYYNNNPSYEATLQNKTDKTLYNVIVKFTFFPPDKYTCKDPAFDTQYVNVASVVYPGDSVAIKTAVQTPFDTSGRFTWCSQVVGAKLTP